MVKCGSITQATHLVLTMHRFTISVPLLVAATVFLTMPGIGQGRIYVVDAKLGSGAQFADIPAAIAVAGHGDRIVVRQGRYSHFTLTKGVSIVGLSGVSIDKTKGQLDITGLPLGRVATLQNLSLQGFFFISKCSGRVVLDQVQSSSFVSLTDSPLVFVRDCYFTQFAATRSGAQITGGKLGGMNAYETLQVYQRSVVGIAGCSVTGGAALFWTWAAADVDQGSVLTITGNRNTRIASVGLYFPNAIIGTGTVVLDPRVSVVPGIAATVNVVKQAVPFVNCTAGPIGGTIDVTLEAAAGQAYFLAGGVHGDPMYLAPLKNILWLDLRFSAVVASGTLGSLGRVKVQIPVPLDPVLLGRSYVWQGVAGAPLGQMVLSNPCAYAHGL